MSYFKQIADLLQEVNLTGLYQGRTARQFHITGRRSGFNSTSVLQDVSEVLGTTTDSITDLAGTETLEVVSSSINDDGSPAGTGAQTIKVAYIDTNGALVESGNITLNGTTAVALGFSAKALLWFEVTAAGSGGVAAGNIVIRNATGPVNLIQITAGGSKSLACYFMVPTGYTAYIPDWGGNAIGTTQDIRLRATVGSYARDLQSPYHFVSNIYLGSGGTGEESIGFLAFPAGTRIKTSTVSGASPAGNRADSSFNVVIIANS